MFNKKFWTYIITFFIVLSFTCLPAFTQEPAEKTSEAEEAEEIDPEGSQMHEKDDIYYQLELFSTALSFILQNYHKDLNKNELEDVMSGAIKGMLQGLGDRYSFYQSESRRRREQENLFYAKFGGLGIRILPSPDGFVSIVQPMPGTPAMKAGIHSGDKIVKVDGESIQDKSMEDVVNVLRGEVGTDVVVTIVRPGRDLPFDVTITRGIITFPSISETMIDNDIGYISISSFTAETGTELIKSVNKLREKGMKALILNLRNNTGGMMSSAVAVSDAFLDGGNIVSTDGKLDRFDSSYDADKEILVPMDMPMVVLVNKNSASGSEIVAGALKDHKRALIIGQNTFGKGVVQQRFPLDEYRAVSITVSIYKTPNGEWIHEKGIKPDIEVEQPKMFEDVDTDILNKFYEGEYVDTFVYEYLDKHPDQSSEEQLNALKEKTPELIEKMKADGIELDRKIVDWYIRRTFASTKYVPNIDLEVDKQLIRAVEEIKKQLETSS